MVRQTGLVLAVCALSVATQAAPLVNEHDDTNQILFSSDSIKYEVVAQPQHTPTPSPTPRIEYWIDEFDNYVPVRIAPPVSRRDRRRHTIPTTSQDNEIHQSDQAPLTTSTSTIQPLPEDESFGFYRAHVAGYMDLMSRFGSNLDLDQEYIHGFSYGVAILVFAILGGIVLYLVALPAAVSAWRRAASRRSLGHTTGMSKLSM